MFLSVNVWSQAKIPDDILDFQGAGPGDPNQGLQTLKGDSGNYEVTDGTRRIFH